MANYDSLPHVILKRCTTC